MLYTGLLHSDLVKEQPSLEKHSNEGFDSQITDSYYELVQDLINKSLEIRKLGTELVLASKNSYESTQVHDQSKIDNINRQFIFIEVYTDVTQGLMFELFGSNTKDEQGVSILTIQISEKGITKKFLPDLYKYYTLKKLDTTTSTYKAILMESAYYYLHLYKTLHKIYSGLTRLENDFFSMKSIEYYEKYNTALAKSKFSYDLDDDDEIDSNEADRDTRLIRLILWVGLLKKK